MTPIKTRRRPIAGIHHITAVAASPAANLRFYSRVLGLRLVKRTVNFDDPYTYHLYYGDATGQPGTILTFFPWEQARKGKAGAGMVTATAFSIPVSRLEHWRRHLTRMAIDYTMDRRFGESVIQFDDPHGLHLELIASGPADPASVGSSGGPLTINGIHSATLLVNRFDATRRMVGEIMDMAPVDREGNRYRFAMRDSEAPGHLLDVVADPAAERGVPGTGTAHHIAFRSEDGGDQKSWQHHLRERQIPVTAVRDRYYVKSIYFNEPDGILFEIATDPPGFAVDEAPHALGSALKLPPHLMSMRQAIENRLPPLEASALGGLKPSRIKSAGNPLAASAVATVAPRQ